MPSWNNWLQVNPAMSLLLARPQISILINGQQEYSMVVICGVALVV
jgi:hypothetical protein